MQHRHRTGAANRVLSAWPLTASGTSTHNAKLAELEGITLGSGDFLSGIAGTAAAITITLSPELAKITLVPY